MSLTLLPATIARARVYRRARGHANGYVFFYRGTPVGWSANLEPSHWESGVIAVSADDQVYLATGGNPQNGASSFTFQTAN